MFKTYRKQLLRGFDPSRRRVTLNKYVEGPQVCSDIVFYDGHAQAQFGHREASLEHYRKLCREGPEKKPPRLDDWREAARDVIEQPKVTLAVLNFALLASLNLHFQEISNCHKTTKSYNALLLRLIGSSEIPADEEPFHDWLQDAITAITAKCRTQSTATRNLVFLVQMFGNMERFPSAFKSYLHLIPLVKGAAENFRLVDVKRLEPIKHHEPYNCWDIQKLLSECKKFEHVCLILLYLTGGFRGGEAEGITSWHIISGSQLDIESVQTKTKGRKKKETTPVPVSLAFKAILAFKNDAEWAWEIDEARRQRFRATCATHLSLAGMPTLQVAHRLGHTTRKMTDEHYVRPAFIKNVLKGHPNLQSVLFPKQEFRVSGKSNEKLDENLWDWWILYQFIIQAKRFGRDGELKEVINRFVPKDEVVEEKQVIDF